MKKSLVHIFLASIILIVGICIYMAAHNREPSQIFFQEQVINFSQGWQTEEFGKVNLPTKLDIPIDTQYTLTKKLPNQLPEGMTICIRQSHQAMTVSVEGDVLFEFGTDSSEFWGKTAGSLWVLVRIPEEYAGKDIKLTLSTPYEKFSGNISAVFYGSKSANLFYIIGENGIGAFIGIFIIIIGLLLISISAFPFIRTLGQGMFILGLFDVLIGIWVLGESRILQFFMGNTDLTMYLTIVAVELAACAFILYLANEYGSRAKKALHGLFWMNLLTSLLCVGLQLFQVKDLFETLAFSHAIIIISVFVTGILTYTEITKYKNKAVRQVAYIVGVVLIFGIIEIVAFYLGYGHPSMFLRIGILIDIVLLGMRMIKELSYMLEKNRERVYYEKLAYQDFLTKGNNRAAFYRDINRTFEQQKNCKSLWLIMFDLNDLKKINDEFGHLMGDQALVDTYFCMLKAFEAYGTCYRMGGDEFSCLIKMAQKEELMTRLAVFDETVKTINKTSKYQFHVAYGYVPFDQSIDTDLNIFINRADKLMYANKKKSKAKGIIYTI